MDVECCLAWGGGEVAAFDSSVFCHSAVMVSRCSMVIAAYLRNVEARGAGAR